MIFLQVGYRYLRSTKALNMFPSEPSSTVEGMRKDGLWAPGELAYFEAHTDDPELGMRSHQAVIITAIEPSDGLAALNDGVLDPVQRIEAGMPILYSARFVDGTEHVLTEDEVLTHPKFFDEAFAPIRPLPIEGFSAAA